MTTEELNEQELNQMLDEAFEPNLSIEDKQTLKDNGAYEDIGLLLFNIDDEFRDMIKGYLK